MKPYLIIKRILDFVFAFVILIILSPIMFFSAIGIKIESKGSIFFTQERVGTGKRIFKLYKFRSMKKDEKAERSFDFTKDKQRITKLGKILRRTKIDELPQLINVLKGDMSLVGPRPTVKIQVDKYSEHEMQRLQVTPGMTGLAQVNGNTALSWDERIEYDIYYVQNISFIMDIRIIMKTVVIVLFGEEKFKKVKSKVGD